MRLFFFLLNRIILMEWNENFLLIEFILLIEFGETGKKRADKLFSSSVPCSELKHFYLF